VMRKFGQMPTVVAIPEDVLPMSGEKLLAEIQKYKSHLA